MKGSKIIKITRDFFIITGITAGIFLCLEVFFYARNFKPLSADPQVSHWDPFSPLINLCESDPYAAARECGPRDERAPDTITAHSFGGSSMSWSHIPEEPNFIELTNAALVKSGSKIKITNYAGPCKDSYYIKECAHRTNPAHPTYVLFYEGHNDLINIGYLASSTLIGLKRNPQVLGTFQQIQAHSYTYRWIADNFANPNAKRNKLLDLDMATLVARQNEITKAFLENVKDLTNEAQANGSKVILMTTISNLKDMTPLAELEAFVQNSTDVITTSRKAFGDGRRFFAEKNYEESLRNFVVAKDTDLVGSRALSTMNEGLRKIATENKDVILVDLEKIFWQRFQTEGIGCNLFGTGTYCDRIHPNLKAKEIIASILAPIMIEAEAARGKTAH